MFCNFFLRVRGGETFTQRNSKVGIGPPGTGKKGNIPLAVSDRILY